VQDVEEISKLDKPNMHCFGSYKAFAQFLDDYEIPLDRKKVQ
jgi:hypothetical protein